jgi:peptidoglycan/LPS O-acetylase OafA/YrhL
MLATLPRTRAPMPPGKDDEQSNNFDLLRLALALLVFASHAPLVGAAAALTPLGDAGVRAFFVISGCLVVKSWEESRTTRDYIARRARRIYPAYALVVIACATAGTLLTELPLASYLSRDLAAYLAANLVFLGTLHPTLPGVFTHNAETIVNGPLWTLKIEVVFYAVVPIVAVTLRLRYAAHAAVLVYVASVAWHEGFLELARHDPRWEPWARQLPGQMSYFIAGAALHRWGDAFRAHGRRLAVLAPAGFGADHLLGAAVAGPMATALLVGAFALLLKPLPNPARFGDLSYGLYITHYPIYQAFADRLTGAVPPAVLVALALVASLAAAFASWHLVEKPALRRGSHYRRVERVPRPRTLAAQHQKGHWHQAGSSRASSAPVSAVSRTWLWSSWPRRASSANELAASAAPPNTQCGSPPGGVT